MDGELGLQTLTAPVRGMHCAACVGKVERALSGVPGVEKAVVNLATEQASLAFDPSRADFEALQAAVAAEEATKVTLDLTLTAQRLGAVNYLALLSAQQAYQQALLTRVQAQATRLADTVALFQALGGGWWNRADRGGARATASPSESEK